MSKTDLPIAKVSEGAKAYSSASDAACDALQSIGEIKSRDKEQAGVILKGPDGKFYNTGMMSSQAEHFGLRVQMGNGWSIAGIYHTHPYADDFSQYFSPNDIDVANQLSVPSFVRFGRENAIRQYRPNQTPLEQVPNEGDEMSVTRGEHVVCPAPTQTASSQTIPTNNINPVLSSR